MTDLIFMAVIVAACFVLLDRRDQRADRAVKTAQAEHDSAVLELVRRASQVEAEHRAELAALFAEHRLEVQTLCQRIQAPEVAVVQHQQTTLEDENPYPLTDEESAERQNEMQRMIAEMERLENAGLV